MRVLRRVFQRLLRALYRKRVTVLLLLVFGFGIGDYLLWRGAIANEAVAAGVYPIEVTVQDFQPRTNGATLTLKEKNGKRRIAMDVNGTEALVIAREQGYRTQIEPPRSYDLLRDVIQQLGGRLDRVVISDANDTQYFAQLVVSSGGEARVVQARPSDAVALALRAGAPIFVEDKVLEQSGRKGSG